MNPRTISVIAAIATITALLPLEARAQKAIPVQVLSGPFDNPEGSIVGLDGTTIFIANAACLTGKFSFEVGAGYVTKLTIDAAGQLSVVKRKFVTGLTRPFGMAVLGIELGNLPAGTVFG